MQSIHQKEGVAGFFRGLSLRVSKVAPSCAIVIMSYEVLKQALYARVL